MPLAIQRGDVAGADRGRNELRAHEAIGRCSRPGPSLLDPPSSILLCLLAWLCLLGPRPLHCQGFLSGLKLPEYFTLQELPLGASNRLKGLLSGDGRILTNGLWLMTNLVILRLEPDSQTNLIARSPACLVDPQRRVAFSTNRIALLSPDGRMSLQGEGFLCLLTNFNLTLSNRVRTRIPQDVARSAQGATPPQTAATNAVATSNAFLTILSEWANFDYQSNRAVYLRKVRVANPPLRLRAEKLTVQRETNGALQSILAERNVAITNTQDFSQARGDRAFYQASAQRETVLLSGNPAVWQDAARTARGRNLLYDVKRQTLHAEQKASLRLPRASLGQGAWLPERAGPTPAPAPALTNQFIDITAAVLDLQLPATNRPGRILLAQTNVVIVSPADQSRATAERAMFTETNRTLKLSGQAVWVRGAQIMKGDRLLLDSSNKVFRAEHHAYLRVPLADLHLPDAAAQTNRSDAQRSTLNAQHLEITSDSYEYRDETLTFYGQVNGRLLEGETNRGTFTCGWLSLKFTSNQLERISARQDITVVQLPYLARNGAFAARKFKAEHLVIDLNANHTVRRAVARTNVAAFKTELPPGSSQPKSSWLNAERVTADFFPQTNQVQTLVAEQNVLMIQDDRQGSGAKAVYTATNNQVALTGNPRAEMPQMKITDAQVIIWDRARNRFLVDRPKAEGLIKTTNAPPAPAPPLADPKSKKSKKKTTRPRD